MKMMANLNKIRCFLKSPDKFFLILQIPYFIEIKSRISLCTFLKLVTDFLFRIQFLKFHYFFLHKPKIVSFFFLFYGYETDQIFIESQTLFFIKFDLCEIIGKGDYFDDGVEIGFVDVLFFYDLFYEWFCMFVG